MGITHIIKQWNEKIRKLYNNRNVLATTKNCYKKKYNFENTFSEKCFLCRNFQLRRLSRLPLEHILKTRKYAAILDILSRLT